MVGNVKIYFDTEFFDDGEDLYLLSIGMVREDGAEYYAEVADAPWYLAKEETWLAENVIANLTGPMKSRKQIAQEIIEFVGTYPEFWAYFADWDWVLLIRLCSQTGKLLDAPPSWPHLCLDLKQLQIMLGKPPFPAKPESEHNALSDARWNRDSYKVLTDYAGRQVRNLL